MLSPIDIKNVIQKNMQCEVVEVKAEEIFNLNGSDTYEKTNPGTLVKIKTKFNFSPFTLVRRKLENI